MYNDVNLFSCCHFKKNKLIYDFGRCLETNELMLCSQASLSILIIFLHLVIGSVTVCLYSRSPQTRSWHNQLRGVNDLVNCGFFHLQSVLNSASTLKIVGNTTLGAWISIAAAKTMTQLIFTAFLAHSLLLCFSIIIVVLL